MSSLARFDNDGIELVIDTQTGEAYATQAGYARMSRIEYATIRKRCERLKGGDTNPLKTDEIPTPGGLQEVTLVPAKLVFKWLLKDNPELGEAMGEAGATVYLHQLAGFKVTSDAIAPESEKPALTPAHLDLLRSAMSSVPAPLVDGMLLNEVQRYHPELKQSINAAHSLLAANTPIAEILLTPTAIGDRLGTSARVINALLTANGYQIKNPNKGKTEPAYFPTEKGKPYSSNTIATGRKEDNTSYQHTKWVESMVETVRDLM